MLQDQLASPWAALLPYTHTCTCTHVHTICCHYRAYPRFQMLWHPSLQPHVPVISQHPSTRPLRPHIQVPCDEAPCSSLVSTSLPSPHLCRVLASPHSPGLPRAAGLSAFMPPQSTVCLLHTGSCARLTAPCPRAWQRPQGPGQGARWRFGAGTGQAGWLAEGLCRGHPTSCLAVRGAGAVSTLILESSEHSCGTHVCGTAESGCAGQTWSKPSVLQAHSESPSRVTERAFLSIADCPGSCFCSLLSSLRCENVVVFTAVLAGHGTEAARGRLLSCWEETCWETATWAQTQRLPSSGHWRKVCDLPRSALLPVLHAWPGSIACRVLEKGDLEG